MFNNSWIKPVTLHIRQTIEMKGAEFNACRKTPNDMFEFVLLNSKEVYLRQTFTLISDRMLKHLLQSKSKKFSSRKMTT